MGRQRDILEEPLSVSVIDEAVVEHTEHLVGPQPDEGSLLHHAVLADQTDALHDAAEIAQVEDVVRFGRRRQQIGDGRLVHTQCGGYHRVAQRDVLGAELVRLKREESRVTSCMYCLIGKI